VTRRTCGAWRDGGSGRTLGEGCRELEEVLVNADKLDAEDRPAPGESAEEAPTTMSAAADAVAARHSVSFTVPVIGRVWIGEPKHLPFYAGVAILATFGVIEWPVAAVIVVGKLLADNAHRETLRDLGSALEEVEG
jgi:hypothetical protein